MIAMRAMKLTLLLVLAMGLFTDRSQADVIALINGVIIDGTGSEPVTDGTVLIENEIIAKSPDTHVFSQSI